MRCCGLQENPLKITWKTYSMQMLSFAMIGPIWTRWNFICGSLNYKSDILKDNVSVLEDLKLLIRTHNSMTEDTFVFLSSRDHHLVTLFLAVTHTHFRMPPILFSFFSSLPVLRLQMFCPSYCPSVTQARNIPPDIWRIWAVAQKRVTWNTWLCRRRDFGGGGEGLMKCQRC